MRKFLVIALFAVFLLISGAFAENVTMTDKDGNFIFENVTQKPHILWIENKDFQVNNICAEKIVLRLEPDKSNRSIVGPIDVYAEFKGTKIQGKVCLNGKGVPNIHVYDPEEINLVVFGAKQSMIQAAYQLCKDYPEIKPIFVGDQNITETETKNLIEKADIIFIGMTSTYWTIKGIYDKNPSIFSGKTVWSGIMYAESMNLTKIRGETVFKGFTLSQLQNISDGIFAAKDQFNYILNLTRQYPNDHPIQFWLYLRLVYNNACPDDYYNGFLYMVWTHTRNDKYKKFLPIEKLKKPDYFIYRDGSLYTSFDDYKKFIDPSKPTVGIVVMYSTYSDGNIYIAEEIAKKLESKGLNTIIVVGKYYQPIFKGIQEYFWDSTKNKSRVDLIISICAFTIGGATGGVNASDAARFFEKLNVPVLLAIISSDVTKEEWYISEKGLSFTAVYYWLAMPELQGVSEPIIVALPKIVRDSLTGAIVKRPEILPERINKLVERACNWIKLRYKPNSEKKIAFIIYNHEAGKANIGASLLNVPETLIEILKRLKQEGYNVSEIPNNATELVNILLKKAINVATWAPGELEKLAKYAILWDANEYVNWFKKLDPLAQKWMVEGPVGYLEAIIKKAIEVNERKEIFRRIEQWKEETGNAIKNVLKDDQNKLQKALSLLDQIVQCANQLLNNTDNETWNKFYELKKELQKMEIDGLSGWGEPPGNRMVIEKDGKKYIVIPGVIFGNIFIGPEPLAGYIGDEAALYHCQVLPRPHQFLAFYAWLENVFKADAEIHVGKHAKYEWSVLRQTALGPDDTPDICVGNVPQPYIYIVDDIGEGLQAKRRGSAIIVDHRVPALRNSNLYGNLTELANLINQYRQSSPENKDLRSNIISILKQEVKKRGIDKELDINLDNITDDELVEAVDDYLSDMTSMYMYYGLTTFGRPFNDEELSYMVSAMLSIDGTNYTALPNLIGKIKGINYDKATALIKDEINNQCIEICKKLISGKSVDELARELTNNQTLQEEIIKTLKAGLKYLDLFKQCPICEMNNLINCLNGGFVPPRIGNDPLRNPDSLPTGANFYGIDPSLVPTRAAYQLGSKLANMTIQKLGKVPEKIGMILFAVETQRDQGANIAFVLYMMGVKPIYNPAGRVQGVEAIPLSELGRPRVDVIIQSSGLFRDLFSYSVVNVLDIGARVALAASYNTIIKKYPELQAELDKAMKPLIERNILKKGDDPIEMNYIAKHWIELVKKGYDGDLAISRVFTEPVGDYGTRIAEAVEQASTWKDRDKLATLYLTRMCHVYSNTNWGIANRNLFEDLLKGTEAVFHTRTSNAYGIVDVDDWAQYLGGLSLAVEKVNGWKAPAAYILEYSNPARPCVEPLSYAIGREIRARYLNPEWIKGMMKEGYAGARQFSEKFVSYVWLWDAVTPHAIHDEQWNEIVNVYVKDIYNLGLKQFFNTHNPWARQSLIATALVAAYKGFWKADRETLTFLAREYIESVNKYGVTCCHHTCGYIDLNNFIVRISNMPLPSLQKFAAAFAEATGVKLSIPGAPTTPQPSIPGAPSQLGAPTALGRVGIGTAATRGVSPGISGPSGRVGGEIGARGAAQAAGAAGKAGITGAAAGKAYEITPVSKGIGSPSSVPFAGIIGVIILIALIAAGYLLRRPEQ